MLAAVIIQRALNLAGILSQNLQEQDGQEGEDGLFWLNMVLAAKSAQGELLPYFGHLDITAVPNQEIYFVPNLVTAEVLTFTIQEVRYSIRGINRNKYFGQPRAENISSLPFQWYWERVNGGMNIYVYFSPSQEITTFKVTGLIGFSQVTFDTDLSTFVDTFYQNFLIYELAQYLCNFYKISLPPDTKMELKRLRRQMTSLNPRDFSIKKRSLIGTAGILSFAQVNLGRGWTT